MTLCFLDTNLLLYSRDLNSPVKRNAAAAWIDHLVSRGEAVINLQVLNEFSHAALRKLSHLTDETVRKDVEALRNLGDSPIDIETVHDAWRIRASHGYSWFDCLLLASAHGLGCTHFLSEDLQHGRSVHAIRIVNPFLIAPSELLTG